MNYPKIKTATLDFGPKDGGTYDFYHGSISGHPFPSEGEAWAFGEGIKILNKFLFMGYNKQLELLEQLGLKGES